MWDKYAASRSPATGFAALGEVERVEQWQGGARNLAHGVFSRAIKIHSCMPRKNKGLSPI